MIAEPTAAWPLVLKENSTVDVAASASGGARNENRQKSVRGKRRAREGSENAKRRHSEPSLDSLGQPERHHLKYGDVEAVTLFEVVTMGKSAMQAVVDDWIEAYRADRETALLDLISFFIQCSGCKGVVTAEMFQYKQDSDILSKMVEELDEGSGLQYKKFLAFPWILTVTWPMDMDSGEYPLIMPGPYWKRFRSNFCEFLSVLVAQCQYSVIFDSYLMDTLISLLTELSDSRVRAFRHTCTLAAMKLLSALVGVALSLSVSLDNSQRLYEVERVKASCRRSGLRVDRIQRKIDELQDKRLEIENMMDAIFKGVFLKRYRDVVPDIRAICMEELGIWMRLYSSMFLNDSYLKYVGWMLHDKQPDVRLKCVQGLQALYGDAFLVSKLDLFTSRFKERMLSMALDKDHEVAVQAVRLLMIISESCEDVLSAEDCNNLYQLVFSSHRPLASIAGEFLYTKLLSDPAQADGAQQDGQEDLMAARVRTLIQFFRESELHDHVVYLVDSLWDSAGALLKNWTALTSLLFQDAGLSSDQQGLLIEIMLACVRQAAEGPPAAGRGTTKKVVSAKERKAQLDDCVRLTQHFVAVLPELLSKFSEDAEKVSCLLKIPQYFHAEASSVGFPEKHLEALLAQMDATIERHTDAAVLEAGARTFQVLCCEDVPWHNMAQGARDQLVQRWVARLSTLLGDVRNTDGTFSADDEVLKEILSTLKRVATFHNAQDLSRWGIYDMASQLLSAETQHGGLPPQVTVQALQCACYAVLWNLNTCTEVRLTREEALVQRGQLRGFCERCHRFLSHTHAVVREQAFLSLCDLLTAHSYQLQAWDPAAGAPLLYSPDPRLQRALVAFVLEHVFTGTEHDGQSKASEGETEAGRLEELHRRRNLLAAYCKLIVHGVLEMSMAADVFKFYMKYYNDFGDIIKEMLSRTRQMDKIESARTLVLCLQQLFLRLKQEQERGTACSSAVQTFSSIKELARRFSLTFGWDQIKSRESLAMIHRDGIEFVFQGFVQQAERHAPPNISYLTILSEFSSKLLKPDKKTIYAYLQKFAGEQVAGSGTREECWLPLVLYRSSLLATADCEDGASHVSCDTLRHGSLGHPSRSPSLSLKQSICDGEAQGPSVLPAKTPEQKSSTGLLCTESKAKRTLRLDMGPDERLEPEPPPAVRVPEPVLVPSLRQLSATDEDVDIMDISP
ncbi:cohesin subunit SA-2 [Scleropages formosus]|uniref:Cohesin subunit SA n=1 Tax=Scleropages formosus TaxID=113540 RepID=A0A8C9SYR5_SCLFO|nr:cohesin subunit SA-2-like [Scleropages formosus]XP_018594725.2 cohesin subunit SA-2-like [Scleropages formosus]XP_018594726.2 cohesin subunit SA-2-like [Scleropages formosus]